MQSATIRALFLNYFKGKEHTLVESSSLVPQNDPSLLFTNAGMVQFKDVFLGKEFRPYQRAVTAQKCVRAGGKHNDLENVGFTARHHVFFEMLGNFSFGDYFKREAIRFGWEFITQELKLPEDRLYVSVFENDDEAAHLWSQDIGLSQDRIFRFGEASNFWSMGDTGPCGPCSEIFIDRGAQAGCGKPTCAMGCDCDRYMELWNLVFMQFNRDANGNLKTLPRPSVDTGAGLERLASVVQGVDSNYDIDLFQDIIRGISQLSGKDYDRKTPLAVSFRVIADHSRAITFLVGDGVLPSHEGRGYVLRRIVRRAVRHGKKLGLSCPFLYQVVAAVIEQMNSAYPDLTEKKSFIEKVVFNEEEQFFKTLERGLALLDEQTSHLKKTDLLSGEAAFKLYDTYGFPLDLTQIICSEKGIAVDQIGFEKAMERQRSESRKHWKGSGEKEVGERYLDLSKELSKRGQLPRFLGYQQMNSLGECLAVFESQSLFQAVFQETPFYGESGGQVGDQGKVSGEGFEGDVVDVQKPLQSLIVVHIRPKQGVLTVGKSYYQEVDSVRRAFTSKNHTGAHLLHWALREVLGPHVKQAGSWVGPDLLRFDFSHFEPLHPKQLEQVEDLINHQIWGAQKVKKQEMSREEAIETGALAFFGEKYGSRVRVVDIGNFSVELCGGTHVENASEIHLFKIVSENGIAAGVRRITAYTSQAAFGYLRSKKDEMQTLCDRLKVSSSIEAMSRIDKMALTERELRQELEKFHANHSKIEVDFILKQFLRHYSGLQTVVAICDVNPNGIKHLRELAALIKQKIFDSTPGSSFVIVLGMKSMDHEQAFLLAATGGNTLINANRIIQQVAPLIHGKGGGKSDLSQAAGSCPDGLKIALEEADRCISGQAT